MAQTTRGNSQEIPTPTGKSLLPDVFSTSLVEMFARVQASIVQVGVEGRGGGTGIIWHDDGRIITNHHVVANEQTKIQLQLVDGRTLAARVLHRNPRLDLALLKVDALNLHALTAGKSTGLRIGEWVFAIGHPWGQRWALTAGIVSSMSAVKIDEQVTTRYIKSDVGLAPGNSGGPLLDADGNVVGVNAMIFGGDLSVAIPSDVVSAWLAELSPPTYRVTLGIEIQPVEIPPSIRAGSRQQQASGLLIVGISAERQASYSDLLVGDVLLTLDDKIVGDGATLRNLLAQSDGRENVVMKVLRGGEVVTLNVATRRVEQAA
jgi:serine protease Do